MWHIIYITPAHRYILDEDDSTWIGAGTKGESIINFFKKNMLGDSDMLTFSPSPAKKHIKY